VQILFITPFYAPEWKFGGPPRKISSLAKELTRRGHNVRVVTFHSERPNERGQARIDSIDVQYLPWLGTGLRQWPRDLGPLRQEIEAASIVHCYGLYNSICPAAARLALRSSTPFVIEPMGMFVPRVRRFFLKRIYNAIVTRRLFRHAAAVIATSELEARELRNGHVAGKILVRHNGISLDFSSDPNAAARLRSEWSVASENQLIGYIGRISRKKGLIQLIAAFDRVNSSAAKLLIAGPVSEPSYLKSVKDAVQASPRRDDVILEGLLEGGRYLAALQALDLFVLPSENENFGNSAAEAVMAGVPVLLTQNCGIAPTIDGRVGLAVEYEVGAIAEGLRTMLRPETRQRWASHWQEVRSELSWDEPVQVMEGIYERIFVATKSRGR
jgi:glycosyltransferase involved in cell wall biosynthesis